MPDYHSNSGSISIALRNRWVATGYRQTSTLVPRCGIEVCAYLFIGKLLQPLLSAKTENGICCWLSLGGNQIVLSAVPSIVAHLRGQKKSIQKESGCYKPYRLFLYTFLYYFLYTFFYYFFFTEGELKCLYIPLPASNQPAAAATCSAPTLGHGAYQTLLKRTDSSRQTYIPTKALT